MQPARQDLPVIPGTTYRDTMRIMQTEFVYHDISVIAGAPVRLTIPGHGLESDWPIWVRGVQGMTDLNREPVRQLPHKAKLISADAIEINALSATGLRPTGGQIIYRSPVNISEAAIAMTISRGALPVMVLGLGSGLEVTAPGTISRVLTAAQTALLTGEDLTYTLEVTYAGPTVTRYFVGAIGANACTGGCADLELLTWGEQGAPGVGAAELSSDPNNRIKFGSDQKLYVSDDLIPNPLNYYILAKG